MSKNSRSKAKNPYRRHNFVPAFYSLVFFSLISGLIYIFIDFGLKPKTPEIKHSSEIISQNQSNNHSSKQSSDPAKNTPDSESERIPFNKTPIQNEGENPNQQKKLSGYITYSGQIDDQWVIYTTINQIVKGTCSLELSNSINNQVIKETSKLITNPTSSSCETFNIPLSKLGDIKRWKLLIKLTSGDHSGEIRKDLEL